MQPSLRSHDREPSLIGSYSKKKEEDKKAHLHLGSVGYEKLCKVFAGSGFELHPLLGLWSRSGHLTAPANMEY